MPSHDALRPATAVTSTRREKAPGRTTTRRDPTLVRTVDEKWGA